ncbi:MAG: hypothetical protein HY830_15720 [Actinobacteria bacterium]|nr:hypothetical protein [Actinomycetota bacterium]
MIEDDQVIAGLGAAIRAWHADVVLPGDACELRVEGPLPALGMDPVWIVQFRSPWWESEVFLFRGPHVEAAFFDPRQPEAGVTVEGHDDLTPESITHLLRRLVRGETAPS